MATKPAAAEPAGPAGPTLGQINQAIRAGDHETLAKLLSLGSRPEVRCRHFRVQPSQLASVDSCCLLGCYLCWGGSQQALPLARSRKVSRFKSASRCRLQPPSAVRPWAASHQCSGSIAVCSPACLPAGRLHLLQVPLVDDSGFGEGICFSYDGSEGSDLYGAMDLQDPFYTLLLGGGIQDSRVGRAGRGGAVPRTSLACLRSAPRVTLLLLHGSSSCGMVRQPMSQCPGGDADV